MSAPSLLLDENVPAAIRRGLLRRVPEMVVQKVGDPGAPPKGTPDPVLLCWCEENGYILVTDNRKSMPGHLAEHLAQGRHVPGILELNEGMRMGDTLDDLILVWGASLEAEFADDIKYLPIE